MLIKIPNWLKLCILISVGIVIFVLIRGCKQSKKQQLEIINYKEKIKKHKQDSIEQVKEKAAYQDSMEFIQGQWGLSKNRELALNEDLGKANQRITKLLGKHVPIKPSLSDTGIITVPLEYVRECEGCYEELANGQQLVIKYKAEKDNQFQILSGKMSIKDNRISFLEKSNAALGLSNSALLSSAKEMQDKWTPRGRLYLSWGVLWKDYVPWAAGAGMMYQTKRNLIMGASWYYNAQGHIVQTNIHFPLSLKRR